MPLPTPKEQLLADLENVFSGQPWFGNSVLRILESVSPQQAITPVAGRRIYTLVLHMLAWRDYALRQLLGEADFDIETDSVVDWPPYGNETAAAWSRAIASLKDNQQKLVTTLRNLPDERLYATVPRRPFSFAFLVNGLIQHDAYHLGQIALLRKLL
jgi:hypothetical protein